jgi:spore photoproduct lyase
MIYIVTALSQEALPIIRHFKLKKNLNHNRFDVYENEQIKLIISGTGKIKSAIATTYLLLKDPPKKSDKILNIGICGSVSEKNKIGQINVINKIKDISSDKIYYPEILYTHNFSESSLSTYEIPATKTNSKNSDKLIDMEASGFFESANTFVLSHNIIILKIVSDYLSNEKFSGAFVQSLIEKNLPYMITILNQARKKTTIQAPETEILDSKEFKVFEDLSDNLQLSTTQRFQVLDMIKGHKIRSGKTNLDLLKEYSKNRKVNSKQETKKVLDELKHKLEVIPD